MQLFQAVAALHVACCVFIGVQVLTVSASTCPSFTSSVEEGRAVCPGEELTYNCTIFDNTTNSHTAVWSGFCDNNTELHIVHAASSQLSDTCGPFTVNATGSDGDCYTSTLTVTASTELSGRVINCSHESDEVGRATLLVANSSELDLNVDPTYDADSRHLESIATTFKTICSPSVDYTVRYMCYSEEVKVEKLECTSGSLFNELEASLIPNNVSACNVTVSAAGVMDFRTVTTSNKHLSVTIDDTKSPATIYCSFGRNYKGHAHCEVEIIYRDGDRAVDAKYVVSSNNCTEATENTSLAVYLPPNTEYTFKAFAVGDECHGFIQPISMSGTGSTGNYTTCNESLLLGVSIENCSSCGNSIDGAQGCVSLTSPYPPAMPGAVATYTCCDGYEALLGVLTPLECMPNGNWNGTPPACVKREATTCNESFLLGVSIENCSSCGNSIDGAQGCVSLTSPYPPAMPGAVATYTCCDGYEALLGVLTPLECMPNGNWNGTPPACVKKDTSGQVIIGLSVGLAVAVILIIIGIPIAIVVPVLVRRRSKAKKGEQNNYDAQQGNGNDTKVSQPEQDDEYPLNEVNKQ